MAKDAAKALESELGGRLPDSVKRLDPAALADLKAGLRQARRDQAAQLAAAGDRALGYVPRLLRGPVRKVLR